MENEFGKEIVSEFLAARTAAEKKLKKEVESTK